VINIAQHACQQRGGTASGIAAWQHGKRALHTQQARQQVGGRRRVWNSRVGRAAKALGQLQRAIGVIHQAQAFRDATHPNGYTESQIRSGLGTKYQIPDYLIETAYQLVGYGSIDQQQAQILHSIGLRGGTYNGQSIKVTPNYKAPNPYTGAPAPPLSAGNNGLPGGL